GTGRPNGEAAGRRRGRSAGRQGGHPVRGPQPGAEHAARSDPPAGGRGMSRCPTPDRLELLLAERLGAGHRDPLEAHLQDCGACQAALERLVNAGAEGLRPAAPAEDGPTPEFLEGLKRQTPPARPAGAVPFPTVPGYEVLEELGRGGT